MYKLNTNLKCNIKHKCDVKVDKNTPHGNSNESVQNKQV